MEERSTLYQKPAACVQRMSTFLLGMLRMELLGAPWLREDLEQLWAKLQEKAKSETSFKNYVMFEISECVSKTHLST